MIKYIILEFDFSSWKDIKNIKNILFKSKKLSLVSNDQFILTH